METLDEILGLLEFSSLEPKCTKFNKMGGKIIQ